MKRAQILSASAGSGKTFRLVLKYICDIIERPDRYRNILAVTFTNKATEEMKSRIINEIHRLASNQPSQYLKEVILKIAEKWNSEEQLVISTAEAEELKAFFAAKAKALLDKGVEIKEVNGVKGFTVSPADGSYKVSFGAAEFESFLKSFLRPQIVELLF